MREQPASTRDRILEAATEVFLDKGFAAATVRDICKRAGANVAAVNYHFKDKGGLYLAVLENIMVSHLRVYPPDMGLGEDSTVEERLAAFIRSFLLRIIVGDGRCDPDATTRLMAEAMVSPSPYLDHLAKFHMLPLKAHILDIVSDYLGEPKDSRLVLDTAASIVGQVLFYFYLQPAMEVLGPGVKPSPEDVDRLAAHVTAFSLAGLQDARHRAEHPA